MKIIKVLVGAGCFLWFGVPILAVCGLFIIWAIAMLVSMF